jgi:hypothetical protein
LEISFPLADMLLLMRQRYSLEDISIGQKTNVLNPANFAHVSNMGYFNTNKVPDAADDYIPKPPTQDLGSKLLDVRKKKENSKHDNKVCLFGLLNFLGSVRQFKPSTEQFFMAPR